ncbi:hypothetical protein [Bacillus cereus group sp. BfR-BA-01518]|uniref:hypothetical protein n=1 Tax=Bacillus cereus group sp. BfR-BA-01518 TaxID=2920368 RepID=UPI001F577556|nr:hypothetical protein [Bacillus cereus group sp. BfR-BA-01518]
MIRNSRLLRSKEVEFFEIENETLDTLGYMLFIDKRRESKLSDFPELIGVETEEDFEPNDNHIQVIIFKKEPLNESILEQQYLFIESMLGRKASCSYHVSEYITNKQLIVDMPDNLLSINTFISELLSEINQTIDLSQITEKQFNYLSQE